MKTHEQIWRECCPDIPFDGDIQTALRKVAEQSHKPVSGELPPPGEMNKEQAREILQKIISNPYFTFPIKDYNIPLSVDENYNINQVTFRYLLKKAYDLEELTPNQAEGREGQ